MGNPAPTSRTGRSAVGLLKETPRQCHDRMLHEIDIILAEIDATLAHCWSGGKT